MNVLWLDATQTRYFLIPADQQLPFGTLAIRTLSGEERYVEPTALAVFEIDEAAAKAHIQGELEQTFKQAGTAFTGFLTFAGLLDRTANRAHSATATRRTQSGLDQIAALLGVSPAELRRNPSIATEGVLNLLSELQTILEGMSAGDPAGLEVARERVHALRIALHARGIDTDATLEDLPDKLQLLLRLGEEHTVEELASNLKSFTEQLDQSPETLGRRIDKLIERLENTFGVFFREDQARVQAKKEREYEQLARNAIATSLRAHGITPIASADPQAEPDSQDSQHQQP